MKAQYFGFLNSLSEEELRTSPRLQSHASGVLLGVTQIVNGLENPVNCQYFKTFSAKLHFNTQLVVAEVANKFAQSHFNRGVRDNNVRLLAKVIMEYIQVSIINFGKSFY